MNSNTVLAVDFGTSNSLAGAWHQGERVEALALDPHADASVAAQQANANGLEGDSLKRMASVELSNRGMGTQYPAILVFSGGKIAAPALGGPRSNADYEAFIQEHLAPRTAAPRPSSAPGRVGLITN